MYSLETKLSICRANCNALKEENAGLFKHIRKLEAAHSTAPNTSSPKLPDRLLNFMCYLVDNCEGVVITEEFLLKAGSDFIAGKIVR